LTPEGGLRSSFLGERQARAWWRGPRSAQRPARRAQRKLHGTRCLERHHPLGAQRVHLLGRGREARDNAKAPHSQDPRGVGGRPAPAMLLAWVQAPKAHGSVSRDEWSQVPAKEFGTRRRPITCIGPLGIFSEASHERERAAVVREPNLSGQCRGHWALVHRLTVDGESPAGVHRTAPPLRCSSPPGSSSEGRPSARLLRHR
jgi:hypothetical protein